MRNASYDIYAESPAGDSARNYPTGKGVNNYAWPSLLQGTQR